VVGNKPRVSVKCLEQVSDMACAGLFTEIFCFCGILASPSEVSQRDPKKDRRFAAGVRPEIYILGPVVT